MDKTYIITIESKFITVSKGEEEKRRIDRVTFPLSFIAMPLGELLGIYEDTIEEVSELEEEIENV